MAQDWQTLTKLTSGADLEIERVRLVASDVRIEGHFELPALARLTAEDQTFVTAFVRCHGSIKQMEKYFGVSYPTIKNRLNRIGEQLPFAEIDTGEQSSTDDLLTRLERGELSVKDVLAQLENQPKEKS